MAVDPFDPAEFGGGHGEPSLTAAAAVGSKGMFVCIDLSADMPAFAQQRASAAGLHNVGVVERTHPRRFW
jgi:ubiquinone/menaquinone biosynthesis C-methylase UbiE